MGLFGKRREGGIMDAIRCDEKDFLIWKWRPKGAANSSNRENAIRWGSSLRVRDGQVAILQCSADESYRDVIRGPYDGVLETGNLPVIAAFVGIAYDGGTPLPAEVYFINTAKVIQSRFGVPFFDVFDPRLSDYAVPVSVRGTITFGIRDYSEFIEIHGLNNFEMDDFNRQIRAALSRYVKGVVTNIPQAHGIAVTQLETSVLQVNEYVESEVSRRLERDFGVRVAAIDIETIEVDKTSSGYRRLMSVTRDISEEAIKTQARINLKNMEQGQRINAEHVEESLRIQREEEQRARRAQTRGRFIDSLKIGKRGNPAGDSTVTDNIGRVTPQDIMSTSGSPFQGFGGAPGVTYPAAQSPTMQGTSSFQMGQSWQQVPQAPPPPPVIRYCVAMNGQTAGPFGMAELAQMANSGQLVPDSYVWCEGMANWERASNVADLRQLFSVGTQTAPPIPPDAR